MSVYRVRGEADVYLPSARPSPWSYRFSWAWRIALVVQGPIVAGAMQDMSRPGISGLCFGVGFVAAFSALIGFAIALENPPKHATHKISPDPNKISPDPKVKP